MWNSNVESEELKNGTPSNPRKVKLLVTPEQAKFMQFVMDSDVKDFCESLKLIHDFALYHTDLVIDNEEKFALFNLKILWQEMEPLVKKS